MSLAPGFPRQKAPRRARSPRQRLGDRCDVLFSQLVRRAGRCVECGATSNLECAHGMRRGYRATRWDFRNAFCLCSRCHGWYTDHPPEWTAWLIGRLGLEFYLDLEQKALSGVLEPLDDVWARLRELERRAA
jgi:hypothetical protein